MTTVASYYPAVAAEADPVLRDIPTDTLRASAENIRQVAERLLARFPGDAALHMVAADRMDREIARRTAR